MAVSQRDVLDLNVLRQSLSNSANGFVVAEYTYDGQQCLILTHQQLFNHPPFGPTSRVRILIRRNEFVVHVLSREVQCGDLLPDCPDKQMLELCKRYSLNSPSFKFCPGIDVDEYEQIRAIIRFDLASVWKTTEPFCRIDSINCLLWFELGAKCTNERRLADTVVCPSCVRLKSDLQHQLKRTTAESPSKRLKRQSSLSRAHLTYMSPSSQKS